MQDLETSRRCTGLILTGVTLLTPRAAWAIESAPDANTFGLLLLAVLVLAVGVGVWISLREQQSDSR